jgi:hypothetical protein
VTIPQEPSPGQIFGASRDGVGRLTRAAAPEDVPFVVELRPGLRPEAIPIAGPRSLTVAAIAGEFWFPFAWRSANVRRADARDEGSGAIRGQDCFLFLGVGRHRTARVSRYSVSRVNLRHRLHRVRGVLTAARNY